MTTPTQKINLNDQTYARSLLVAERDLAVIMGYREVSTPVQTSYNTNLTGIGIGKPTPEELPKWCRGWFFCAPLIIQYQVSIEFKEECNGITASSGGKRYSVQIDDHFDAAHALHYAVVKAVTMRLAGAK